MEFTVELMLDLPRDVVVELHYCSDNLPHWMEGFVSFEHVDGEHGAVGATYRSAARFGGVVREYTDTIIRNDLPDAFHQVQEFADVGLCHEVHARFTVMDPTTTRWSVWHRFSGGGIEKMDQATVEARCLGLMRAFKAFAERRHAEPVRAGG